MLSLFLGTNILMEIIFQRNKVRNCIKIIANYQEVYISSLCVHICMYHLEKDMQSVIPDFIEIIETMNVLDLDSATIFRSFDEYDENDFEDWLQINSCLLNKISNFLTLDQKLSKKHSDKLNIILP
jgi:predicted nucleic-acid-binding protein